MPYWYELSHVQFLKAAKETEVVVMVAGAVEAHGHHLPLGTDVILPEYLAECIVEKTDALVLPPIPFGDSWVFNDFEGTITISSETLTRYYQEVMEGVFRHGFRYIVFLNGHGGNVPHIEQAARRSTEDGERAVIIVNWWRDLAKDTRSQVLTTPEGHAAEDETSEMLHVRPDLVHMDMAVASRVVCDYKIVSGQYRSEIYKSATSGDPTSATSEKGKAIMEAACEDIIHLINDLSVGKLPIRE